jgi:hypothetical protein
MFDRHVLLRKGIEALGATMKRANGGGISSPRGLRNDQLEPLVLIAPARLSRETARLRAARLRGHDQSG